MRQAAATNNLGFALDSPYAARPARIGQFSRLLFGLYRILKEEFRRGLVDVVRQEPA